MDIQLMINVEQTDSHSAFSCITFECMWKYNNDKAIVSGTYHYSLRKVHNEVSTNLGQAKCRDFYFGTKLVRS